MLRRQGIVPPRGERPPHARVGTSLDRETPVGRAAYNVLLVIEDPAAAIHNPAYAAALLDAAEAVLMQKRSAP
jgi:hypothetical protein